MRGKGMVPPPRAVEVTYVGPLPEGQSKRVAEILAGGIIALLRNQDSVPTSSDDGHDMGS